jgi:hypothetical protein
VLHGHLTVTHLVVVQRQSYIDTWVADENVVDLVLAPNGVRLGAIVYTGKESERRHRDLVPGNPQLVLQLASRGGDDAQMALWLHFIRREQRM